jgi:hypothetical protein
MCRTRSAASAAGSPAAVTSNGRAEDPRTTGTAWVAVREPGPGHPGRRDAEPGVRMRTEAGPAAGVQIGVTAGQRQAQPAQIVRDRAQQRELAQAESARPAGRYPGYRRGASGHYVREGGIGGQHGCRPGAAGPQVMDVHGCAHAGVRVPAGVHVLRMPGPVSGTRTMFWQLPARASSNRSGGSRSVIGLRQSMRTCSRRYLKPAFGCLRCSCCGGRSCLRARRGRWRAEPPAASDAGRRRRVRAAGHGLAPSAHRRGERRRRSTSAASPP